MVVMVVRLGPVCESRVMFRQERLDQRGKMRVVYELRRQRALLLQVD